MMNERVVPPHIINFAEKLLEDCAAITPSLKKSGINYDHFEIKKLLETAYLHSVLIDILRELRSMNARAAKKELPYSLLNFPIE